MKKKNRQELSITEKKNCVKNLILDIFFFFFLNTVIVIVIVTVIFFYRQKVCEYSR